MHQAIDGCCHGGPRFASMPPSCALGSRNSCGFSASAPVGLTAWDCGGRSGTNNSWNRHGGEPDAHSPERSRSGPKALAVKQRTGARGSLAFPAIQVRPPLVTKPRAELGPGDRVRGSRYLPVIGPANDVPADRCRGCQNVLPMTLRGRRGQPSWSARKAQPHLTVDIVNFGIRQPPLRQPQC